VVRQRAQRSRGLSAPAKGLDWRSSYARSLLSTRNTSIEEESRARAAVGVHRGFGRYHSEAAPAAACRGGAAPVAVSQAASGSSHAGSGR
jgi:hypothetical protein